MTDTKSESKTMRCGVDVVAGVLPGTPEDEFTRQWIVTSEDWHAADSNGKAQLLSDLAGKANGWATYLMLQPDRVNWVRTDWVWL